MADWAEKNRDHFKYIPLFPHDNYSWTSLTKTSNSASTYNSKFAKTIQQILEEIQARKQWIGVDWVEESEDESETKKSVRLLDYACGTGLVSRVRLSSSPNVASCEDSTKIC